MKARRLYTQTPSQTPAPLTRAGPPPLRKVTVKEAIDWADAVAWDAQLSPCAKALGIVIRSCLDREKGFAFFADETVGVVRTGYERRHLGRARKELVASDYLHLWRPSQTRPWQYYPRFEKARETLAAVKAMEAERREIRRRPQLADDEIPF